MHMYIEVRLVGGPTEYEGTVEVYYNGQWGTICDDGWDLNGAQVVCRQLGYDQAISARSYSFYGLAWGKTFYYKHCFGTESTIGNCLHSGWGFEDCYFHGVAGVKCFSLFGEYCE